MTYFIIVYFLIFLLSFKIKKDKFDVYDLLLLLILILFSGLREVGLDYHLYNKIYNANFSLESRTGIGYTYLMYFFKYIIHLDFQHLIFFISTFTILPIYYFFKKCSDRPGLSILIFVSLGFYTTSFNMFRQSCSIAFVLLGSLFLQKNNKIKCIICFLISFLLHSSSTIAILCYLITYVFKNIRFKFKYMLPISLVALLLYDRLFNLIITLSDSYSMYSSYDAVPGIGTYINVTLYLLFTIFLLIPKFANNNSKNYHLYNLFLIGVSIMILEFKNYLFFRIAFYFTILICLLLPIFYKEHNLRNKKLESLLFYIFLFIYFLVYINSFDGVVPYMSVFTS